MKTLFRLLLLTGMLMGSPAPLVAQVVKHYEALWKKADDMVQKALPKSAIEEVIKIYALARKESQPAQQVKALIYIINLQNREDAGIWSIRELDKEIAAAQEPVRSILKSMQAGLYLQYLQQHRYQLYDRTATIQFVKEDIATWTIEDFHRKISERYLQSIEHAGMLQQTRLEPFQAILIRGNARHLRPTLFDVLAHQALLYFKNKERDLKKPAYAFQITQPEALAPPQVFASARFTTNDSLSLQHKALLLYQELTRFHLKHNQPAALIDLTLDRIEYAYQTGVMENKDSLYRSALTNMLMRYKGQPGTQQAAFLLAQYHNQKALLLQQDSSLRFERRKAVAILEAVVNDSADKWEGWTNSYNLLQELKRPELAFEMEKVNVPGQPFRVLVKYKNVAEIHFRIIQLNNRIKEELKNRHDNRYWETVSALKPYRNWKQGLPLPADWMQHAVEVKADALPVGEYLMVAENKSSGIQAMGAQAFSVSQISYVQKGREYFVLHRQSGMALENAQLQLYRNNYDYTTRKYGRVRMASGTTDRNGYYSLRDNKKLPDHSLSVHIYKDQDSLTLDDEFYVYHSTQEEPDTARKAFFFTDRSIYRPGQTVFFKAIFLKLEERARNVVPFARVKVFLSNANGEQVDSVQLTTSEYGSVSGKFNLPQAALNGQFSIRAENDQGYFSVEEYKRPRFIVTFEDVASGYKVGDSVTVSGTAKAYAGNNISNALVTYRVVRQPRFFYTWRVGSWFPRVEPMEITHGTTTTTADGRFSIRFKALPDLQLDPASDPLFDYRIHADVSDLNGESRSGSFMVTAGYRSLLLHVTVPQRIEKDSFRSIQLRTENLSGTYQPSVVSVVLTKLFPEQRLIRPRYWQQPDQFIFSKEEYIRLFPNDVYSNETEMGNWERGPVVLEKQDSTRMNGVFTIENKNIGAGYYRLEIATADASGKEVKDVRFIEIFERSGGFSKPEFLWTLGNNPPIEPGASTALQVGTAATDVFLIQQIEKGNRQPASYSFYRLSNEKKRVDFSASEDDRGGYGVTWFFVKHNRVYQYNDVIRVPWTNKQLKLEWATFRDKTLPGSEEKWKVKISGYKGDLVAAEMLASLYDASLDQFRPHQWHQPYIWPVYNRLFNWNGNQNFSALSSNQKWIREHDHRFFEKRYDMLNFFIGDRGVSSRQYPYEESLQGKVSGISLDAAIVRETASAAPPADQKQAEAGNGAGIMGAASMDTVQREHMIPMVQPRTNLAETAFFFPDLKTDAEGNIEFSFTTPEALTTWKLQAFSHTKDLAMGMALKEMITQKELMVQPNAPRFLREGDRMEFSAKIVNMGKEEITGQAQLQLFDAATNESVDGWFQNIFPNQYFTVAAGASEAVQFPVEVPYLYGKALRWRIVARAGNKSDGEEQALPVLTNKIRVTETFPLPMNNKGSKIFVFENLKNATSETLQHQGITVEFTSNPAWLAVQALPYLAEPSHENAEQIWNQYFANALAHFILSKAPKLKAVFESWKGKDSTALLSSLQKNQALKQVLLEETPWVLEAKTEAEQKKNIAFLFDLAHMSAALQNTLAKLKDFQSPNGGFVWFKGGPDDRYMTQYIIAGIGHLRKLGGITKEHADLQAIARRGINYLDKRIAEDHNQLLRSKAKLSEQHPGYQQVQYLYMRSFFPEYKIDAATLPAYRFYRKQAQQFWTRQTLYMQGMIALHLKRTGDVLTPAVILQSLKERSIHHEELGRYWKENGFGRSWMWWAAPIETQALMIEVFSEVGRDTATVDALKTWLLKNKQTANWKTTRATAEACYALLLQGSGWTDATPVVQLQMGNLLVSGNDQSSEAGTGYFSRTVPAQSIKPEMGNITVTVQPGTKNSPGPSWGAVYWQYFEDPDKLKDAGTPLQLKKKLFVEKAGDRGPVLHPVHEGDAVQVGDKIKVRIELRADRDMEYVHMKDLRAAALEPVAVVSGYKWQGGLGYYETTKDVSTHFFFDLLRKGTYVFEYTLFATIGGNFSNGIATIQSFYAPEFAARSEGVRIRVE